MPDTHRFLARGGPIWPARQIPEFTRPEPTPRQETGYRCPLGHDFAVPFTAATDIEVEVPDWWECRSHAVMGLRHGCDETQPPAIKHSDRRRLGNDDGRTHWDRLLDRRTRQELAVLLDERLAYLGRCRKLGVPPEPAPTGSKAPC